MTRRARAVLFGSAALACAAMAAAAASGYRASVAGQYGDLRGVVVTNGEIPAHRPLSASDVRRLLAVRRVPERFIPPGAVFTPNAAVGLAPVARVPAGSYLLADQLRAPGAGERRRHGAPLDPGRQAVEITVAGAQALGATGRDPTGMRVDVVVTTEPDPTSRGRTYVAAQGVRLLALTEAGEGPDPSDPLASSDQWTATLGVTRAQALELIRAESVAREVRLIASGND